MKSISKVGILILILIPSILFAQSNEGIKNKESLQKDSIVVPDSDVYSITINKEWKFTSLTKFTEDTLSIPVKFLPPELLKTLDKNKIDKNLIVKRSAIRNLDISNLHLDFNLDSSYFDELIISLREDMNKFPSKPVNAAFVNYSLNSPLDDLDKIKGAFNFKWSSNQNWNISNSTTWDGEKNVRLNSFFQKKLKKNNILTIGDTSNKALQGLNSVNIFGIRLTSSYYNEIQSDYNTPILPIRGFAVNPSKVDLYMNNQIIQKTEINSGKYELQHLLRQNGYGLAQAYVYDIVGNPVIIDMNFYGSNDLIRKGTDAYDISIGTIRKNFGSSSFDYDGIAINALYKKGITSDYTQDVFIQYMPNYQVFSAQSHWIPYTQLGKLSAGLTINSKNQNNYYISLERNTSNFSFNANTQRSALFCPGLDQPCFKEKNQISFGMNLPSKSGQLNLSFIDRKMELYNDQAISATWRKTLSNKVSLNASISKNIQESPIKISALSAYIGLSFALGPVQSNSTISKNKNSNEFSQSFTMSEDYKNPQYGYGSLGFNNKEDNNNLAFNYAANLDYFSYNIFGAKNKSEHNIQGNLSGSILYAPEYNSLTFNKTIDDRFTIVKVHGANGPVPLISKSRKITTNKHGIKVMTDSNFDTDETVYLDVNKLSKKLISDISEENYGVPFAYGNKVEFTLKSLPRNIVINGVEEGTKFYIEKDIYVIGKNGKTSIDKNSTTNIKLPEGKSCDITFKQNIKTYDCIPN